MRSPSAVRAAIASVTLAFVALTAAGCDGATPGPTAETTAPPAVADAPTCADAQLEQTAAGFAQLAVEAAGAGQVGDCAPGEPGQALAAAAADLGALTIEQCRDLPADGDVSTFCWARNAAGQSLTLRLTGSGAARVVVAAYQADGPYADASSDEFVADVPQLPIKAATVRADGVGDASAAQRFADDLYSGSTKAIIEHCWTLAPEYIKSHFGTKPARGAVLEALRQPLQGAQTGVYAEGKHASVYFPWDEFDSGYPCPLVTFNGEYELPLATDYAWEIHRLLGRIKGKPVHAYDTEANYYLYCSNDPGGYPGQDGNDRSGPPTATNKKAVNAALKQFAGADVYVRRNADLGVTLVFSATDPAAPMLVWYDVVGGHCLGDAWS